ncbi:hypothetical protein [Paludibaculum fermentans]|uniref:Uncharacterized protein n=1 Tax=Paludibaculum fermentans TaxID=1473598 RepID=A0A7S7SKK2_PALFE|nr:hypothetical protein [Paludibaculum fermentans]QOY87130.1 hypothetical protein IRI77_30855 [Paludibaculum fermentans]
MATAAQINANQANARKSTGPVTIEGKARSSQNARSHGFTAQHLTITPEDRAAFTALEASLRLDTRPANCIEEEIFHRILTHTWNLRRIESFECLILAETDPLAETNAHDGQLERYARYRRDLERGLYRAIKELSKLQTERAALAQQHPDVVKAVRENVPLAEVTRLTSNTDELFFYEGYGRPRRALEHLTTGIDTNHPDNQDQIADLQSLRIPRNETNPIREDGLPNLNYKFSGL